MHKLMVCALCFCMAQTALATSVTLTCPQVSEVAIEKQPYDEPWREYGYSSQIIVSGLDALGDTLVLKGQGNNPTLTAFSFTTWTDHTFLCWYAGPYGDSVITNMVNLDSVFDYCTFPTAPGPSHDDCTASSPEACPLVCELSS